MEPRSGTIIAPLAGALVHEFSQRAGDPGGFRVAIVDRGLGLPSTPAPRSRPFWFGHLREPVCSTWSPIDDAATAAAVLVPAGDFIVGTELRRLLRFAG